MAGKKNVKELPIVEDMNKYQLKMQRERNTNRIVKNTYIHKDTGEEVQIDWRDGAFRFI